MNSATTAPAEPCNGCGGKGWEVFDTGDGSALQRCDACCAFDSDSDAIELAARQAECFPDLLAAVKLLLALPAVELIKYEYEQSLQFGGDQATAMHFPTMLAACNAVAKAEGRAA